MEIAELNAGRVAIPGAPAQAPDWVEDYQPPGGCYDELLTPDREVRPGYEVLVRQVSELGVEQLRHRAEICQRIIHEQGIAYHVYGDAHGLERPWPLDPLPLILPGREWARLEEGLIQRAHLLNQVLADCYGGQRLVRTGGLPPALVFAQPDFLRPCHGILPPDGVYLHLYAADLARAADGQWWVISDRTQIPTGAGYALANRLVAARAFPEVFLASRVYRLAGFFRELRDGLARLASRRTDDPRVVLLTPGPYNETYFEQAWLARYLGYALVEGQDLTVRDDRVWLKTLAGLEPVDVLVRRVDDDWCDPLELRSDSTLGVPGLVEVLRAGNVAIANALGCGLVQSPALMPFLPGLCQQLLGEELKMPSVATWWCGQPAERAYVLDHLDTLAIKAAFRTGAAGPEPPPTASDREAVLGRLAFQPHAYVAQERIRFATAPAWDGKSIAPLPVALRVYVVAAKGGYRVMPGGLTRVSPDPGARFISMQRGGSSKDTWVLADGPVEQVSLLPSGSQPVELRRVGNNLPSRLADNFFWLGRYCERADATARLLRSTLVRLSPENSGGTMPLLDPLLKALVAQEQLPLFKEDGSLRLDREALETELVGAIFDPQRKGGLRRLADQLELLATRVRDRTSNDLWRVLSALNDRLATPVSGPGALAGEAVVILNQIILGLASFHGLARENMTRAQGWRFLDMGGRIERCLNLATFLDCALRSTEADNPSVLEAVLEVADNTITYRSRYNLLPNIAAVYDLVLLDDTNPRSMLFQLNQLMKHFERLPREKQGALPSPAYRLLIECGTAVRLTDPRPLARLRSGWRESEVGAALDRVLRDLPRMSEAITVSYFAHSTTSLAGGGSR